MLVTSAVFQSAIGPYVAVAVTGSITHAVAAVATFASVIGAGLHSHSIDLGGDTFARPF